MMKFSLVSALLFSACALAAPRNFARSSFSLQNGELAIQQNNQFASLTADSSCTSGENACVNQEFAQCVNGKFVLQSCGSGLICASLPLVNSAGTSITCTTQSDLQSRIAATGASNSSSSAVPSGTAVPSAVPSASAPVASSACAVSASAPIPSATGTASGSGNSTLSTGNSTAEQSSLTLDPAVIATGFESNGQAEPEAGQVASATSSNNFINFCLTTNLPLTNGTQIKTGSCNPAPMGIIASTSNMPSAKFVSPANLATIPANTNFTVQLAISNLATGFFTNADENYFAAPQQVDSTGNVKGHSHIVIEALTSLNQTTATNPNNFAFFKGLNDAAQNGVLSTTVTGLPAGAYRMASINTAMNHQPVLVAIAQHGALDDMIYFTVQ